MTTFILFLWLAGMCGLAFHFFYGQSLSSIPFFLLAAVGGAIVGYTASVLLGLNFLSVGGLPVLGTALGAILFLSLVQRIQVKDEQR